MTPAAGRALLAVSALLLFLQAPARAAIELLQENGSMLVLEHPARKVITLAPNLAELMFAAGAGDLLMAAVEYSDFPAGAAALPRVGDAFRFDLERILALDPDLVIGWQSGNPEAALKNLEALGLPVWRTEIRNPEGIADLLEQIGNATGRVASGQLAGGEFRARLARLKTSNAGKPALSFFYQVAERPLFTVNGEHLISQSMAVCGAENVFKSLSSLAPQISREAVLLADPEVLVAPRLPNQPDPLAAWRAWPRLRAVQNGFLIYLPADEISRATPRLLDSIELACKVLNGFRERRESSSGQIPESS